MKEQELARLWKLGLSEEWRTQEGEKVRVAFPGFPNDDRGPDFIDAVILGEGGRQVNGDVEVHLRASYFRSHGHHLDLHYNNVILHLVLQDDVGAPTVLESGVRVPVLTLDGAKRPSKEGNWPQKESPCPEALRGLGKDELLRVLEGAGIARFLGRARGFSRALTRSSPDEVLYQGIMEALGYSRNRRAFLRLAQGLPWESLQRCGQKAKAGKQAIALLTLLIGSAGLLPSQRRPLNLGDAREEQPRGRAIPPFLDIKEDLAEEIETCWASFGLDKALDETDWHFFRVRPGNSPLRRLAGAALLLSRHLREGLVHGLVIPLEGRSGFSAVAALEGRLSPPEAEGCSPFGPPQAGEMGKGIGIVGKARAREIAVNIVLPFAWAWAGRNGKKGLSEGALEVYQGYPRLAENRISRYMSKKLGLSPAKTKVMAPHQQGLHHIYQTFCRRGDCRLCPFFARLLRYKRAMET